MNGKMNKQWWKCAGIRAVRTVAQTAVATIGASAMLADVNWLTVGSASIMAGVLSLLTSISGVPELKEESQEAKDGAEENAAGNAAENTEEDL